MGSKVNRKPMASEDEDVHAYSIFKKISRIKITVSDCGMTFGEPCSIRCLVLTFIMLCLFIDVNRGLKYNLQRWMYYKSFFPSLGLWRDDMRRETPILKEALKRISRQDLEARNFRIARATVLYNAKIELPREQWTELDEDKLYLTPHVEAIKKELKERKDFEKSK